MAAKSVSYSGLSTHELTSAVIRLSLQVRHNQRTYLHRAFRSIRQPVSFISLPGLKTVAPTALGAYVNLICYQNIASVRL